MDPKVVEVVAIVVANVISVVGVVVTNKAVYKNGFDFPTTLMVMHFLCTWGFVVFAHRMGWFTEKRIPTRQYAMLGFGQMASVGLVNMSLSHNTVGSYQLYKFMTVFVTCFVEFLWLGKVYSIGIYVSLALLVAGVSVATVTQVEFSETGLIYGILGALATAWYQVLNKRIQTEFGVAALQILQFEQPFTAFFAALFSVFTDRLVDLPNAPLSRPSLVGGIFASCVFAFGVNVTAYLIIGKTSPITYSVVGHIKTVGILVLGFLLFGEETTFKHFLGLCMAFGAMVWYSKLSMSAAKAASPPAQQQQQQPAKKGGDAPEDASTLDESSAIVDVERRQSTAANDE